MSREGCKSSLPIGPALQLRTDPSGLLQANRPSRATEPKAGGPPSGLRAHRASSASGAHPHLPEPPGAGLPPGAPLLPPAPSQLRPHSPASRSARAAPIARTLRERPQRSPQPAAERAAPGGSLPRKGPGEQRSEGKPRREERRCERRGEYRLQSSDAWGSTWRAPRPGRWVIFATGTAVCGRDPAQSRETVRRKECQKGAIRD